LAKIWGCKPGEVLKEQTEDVITALEYEKFIGDYEAMAYQIAAEMKDGNR
jgi:ABC-type proline/glycine betaine transport system substrate-binding protein